MLEIRAWLGGNYLFYFVYWNWGDGWLENLKNEERLKIRELQCLLIEGKEQLQIYVDWAVIRNAEYWFIWKFMRTREYEGINSYVES